jgi:hypothetical protein
MISLLNTASIRVMEQLGWFDQSSSIIRTAWREALCAGTSFTGCGRGNCRRLERDDHRWGARDRAVAQAPSASG